MPGFLSNIALEPNVIERARAARVAAGLSLIDLTDSNPTSCGVFFPEELLKNSALRYLGARSYAPDARGLPAARAAIAEWYASRTPRLSIPAENIFLTASSSESYSLLFSLLADPGDSILFPDITYPLFDHLAEHRRVQVRSYRLGELDGTILGEPASDAQTRAVVIVTPHNPTGATVVERLRALDALRLPVIVDEVFAPFTRDPGGAPPLGALHPDLPVFHLNGISKMFALPDLKLGWIALNDCAAALYGERLAMLNDAFLSCSSLAQHLVPSLFSADGLAFVEQLRCEHRRKMTAVAKVLEGSGRWRCRVPLGGAFLFPQRVEDCDEDELVCALIERGVFTYPGYYFGENLGTRIFISTMLPDAALETALGILSGPVM